MISFVTISHQMTYKSIYFVFSVILTMADINEYRLVRDLLRNYDKRIRPSLNASHALNVTFGFSLSQIIDVVSGLYCFPATSAYLKTIVLLIKENHKLRKICFEFLIWLCIRNQPESYIVFFYEFRFEK